MKYSLFFLLDQYQTIHHPTHEIYRRVLKQSQLAEALGYYGVHVAEHHFENYGVLPQPAVLLAFIAGQTSTLKLGTAIMILPFHSPIEIAESFAELDLLSQGRVELGVGSGFVEYEFLGFGLDIKNKRELFDKNLKELSALLRGDHLTDEDKRSVKLNVAPYQHRELPIYLSALVPESAYYIAKKGYRLMAVPFNRFASEVNAIELFIEQYKRGLQEAPGRRTVNDIVMNFYCHVASSDELARENIAKAFGRYVITRRHESERNKNLEAIYDEWHAKGLLLCGSVETVTEKMRKLKRSGVSHVMLFHDFGAAEPQQVEHSMALFANEVIPALS